MDSYSMYILLYLSPYSLFLLDGATPGSDNVLHCMLLRPREVGMFIFKVGDGFGTGGRGCGEI
jgi:hypothetical protein